MHWHSSTLIGISSLLLGCNNGLRDMPPTRDTTAVCIEDRADQTFLGNSRQLRASDGFRQNIWLNFHKDGHGAICMDLDHQLYLVVDTDLPVRPVAHLSKRFGDLRISAATLRKQMDPDAFILGRDGIDWISRIPPDADESFGADLFNELLGLKLEPTDIRFQWD
jgi:hypothetical protein